MPNLFFDLINDELDDEELDDEYLYEKEDFERLDDIDPYADEDEVICLQCKEVVEDGIQCSYCGWIVEIIKPISEVD